MGQGTPNTAIGFVLALIALSLLLLVAGLVLRRRGLLAGRGAALGWAVLTILPLFGGGLYLWTKHRVESATGETQPGVNEQPLTAPAAVPSPGAAD